MPPVPINLGNIVGCRMICAFITSKWIQKEALSFINWITLFNMFVQFGIKSIQIWNCLNENTLQFHPSIISIISCISTCWHTCLSLLLQICPCYIDTAGQTVWPCWTNWPKKHSPSSCFPIFKGSFKNKHIHTHLDRSTSPNFGATNPTNHQTVSAINQVLFWFDGCLKFSVSPDLPAPASPRICKKNMAAMGICLSLVQGKLFGRNLEWHLINHWRFWA